MLSINFGKSEQQCMEFCKGKLLEGLHLKGMVEWVFERVSRILSDKNLEDDRNTDSSDQLQILKDVLTREKILQILSHPPAGITAIQDEFTPYLLLNIYTSFVKEEQLPGKVLKQIFNYEAFRDFKKNIYNGFTLSGDLNINCCPYCNRNYTTTHSTFHAKNKKGAMVEKHVFPEFDHFYPRKEFPILALSFYNLIPSCNICNTHYKNTRPVTELLHPYQPCPPSEFSFTGFPHDTATLYGGDEKITLAFKFTGSKDQNNQVAASIAFFGIQDTYQKCHLDLIRDVVFKKLAFGPRYIQQLQHTYGMTFDDSFKVLFETYFEDDKLLQRPFSKLKKDIYTDVPHGVIS